MAPAVLTYTTMFHPPIVFFPALFAISYFHHRFVVPCREMMELPRQKWRSRLHLDVCPTRVPWVKRMKQRKCWRRGLHGRWKWVAVGRARRGRRNVDANPRGRGAAAAAAKGSEGGEGGAAAMDENMLDGVKSPNGDGDDSDEDDAEMVITG